MPVWRAVVDLTWEAQGSPGVNVWHIRTADEALDPEADINSALELIEAFYQDLVGYYPSTMDISFGGVVQSVDEDPPTVRSVDLWMVSGTNSSGYAPIAVAVVAGWRTALPARSGRGRTFLGPLGINTIDFDGTPKGDVIAAVADAMADLVAGSIGGTGWAIGVWSPTDGVLRDFTGFAVRDTYAVLRSRRD